MDKFSQLVVANVRKHSLAVINVPSDVTWAIVLHVSNQLPSHVYVVEKSKKELHAMLEAQTVASSVTSL